MKSYYVYMVMCRDGTYYIGITNEIERRVAEHNLGIDSECYTFLRRPVVLAYSTVYDSVLDAIACEKKLKRWSHWKKSALARGDWDAIERLSRSRKPSRRACRGRKAQCPGNSARGKIVFEGSVASFDPVSDAGTESAESNAETNEDAIGAQHPAIKRPS